MIYKVRSLDSARVDISNITTDQLTITNCSGSIKYYGMLVIDYIFKVLQQEFTQINNVIVNVDDDHAGLFTAIKLGYKQIYYTGTSCAAKRMVDTLHLPRK